MSAMISLNKLSSSPNVNVNVKPSVNVNVGSQEDGNRLLERGETKVKYRSIDDDNESDATIELPESVSYKSYQKLSEQLTESQNENEVLKLLISMLRNNPLIYNGYIVADDKTLMKFIKLLTSADDVQLDADDIGQGCISKNNYRKVHAIYVIKGTNTLNLKYDFPKVMKELTDLGISTKFVY